MWRNLNELRLLKSQQPAPRSLIYLLKLLYLVSTISQVQRKFYTVRFFPSNILFSKLTVKCFNYLFLLLALRFMKLSGIVCTIKCIIETGFLKFGLYRTSTCFPHPYPLNRVTFSHNENFCQIRLKRTEKLNMEQSLLLPIQETTVFVLQLY